MGLRNFDLTLLTSLVIVMVTQVLFHIKSSKPLVIKLIVEVKVVPNLNRA